MAFNQRMMEEIAAWCFNSTEMAAERKKAWRHFFAEDDHRPVKYWGGAEEKTGRERRFLGWFLFDYVLPSGEKPAEVAVKRLYTGSEQAEALKAVAGVRFVVAYVSSKIGRSVFLKLEDETFEVRSPIWAANMNREQSILAHIVPVRQGYWLPGPGWIVWSIGFGPGIRASLKSFQFDPIAAERLMQGRVEEKEGLAKRAVPRDDTLDKAVSRMTDWAKKRGYSGLVMSLAKWQSLVLKHMTKLESTDFLKEVLDKTAGLRSEEELRDLMDLIMNIWNNTPQPDRGGKTANQMMESI